MNQNQFKGQRKKVEDDIHDQVSKPINDDAEQIAGARDLLIGLIQQLYGDSREGAERRLNNYERLSL